MQNSPCQRVSHPVGAARSVVCDVHRRVNHVSLVSRHCTEPSERISSPLAHNAGGGDMLRSAPAALARSVRQTGRKI